ncbi:MAG: hypothetical protein WCP32_09940 [Bacteroidota bacterium]
MLSSKDIKAIAIDLGAGRCGMDGVTVNQKLRRIHSAVDRCKPLQQ